MMFVVISAVAVEGPNKSLPHKSVAEIVLQNIEKASKFLK